MRKRISSSFTIFNRIFISLFILFFYLIIMEMYLSKYVAMETIIINPGDIKQIIMIHFFFLIMLYIFNIFTYVEIDDQFLYIKGIFKKDQVPFSNMECITSAFGMVVIYFKKKTRFGKKIFFCPYFFLPLFSYPIADELKNQIIIDGDMRAARKKSIFYNLLTKY